MKRSLLSVFLLFRIFFLNAQDHLPLLKIPNCRPVEGHHLYMAETEVSNIQYREFEFWMKRYAPDSMYRMIRPDTLVWRGPLTYSEPFTSYYYQHTAYRDYPVVGITQRQAQLFCIWLRERLLETFRKNGSPIEDIIVRLPTTAEWIMAARGELPASAIYPWEGESIRVVREQGLKKRDLGKVRMNVRTGFSENPLSDGGFITTPVYSYWPNTTGLYNMCGNVAEWVSEPARTKGGSWHTHAYHARLDVPGPYDGDSSARADVGFRYVVEIVKLKSRSQSEITLKAGDIERGFVYADTGLLGSATELSNEEYRLFLQLSGHKGTSQDSLWLQYGGRPYLLMYSQNEIYDNFPVVNVSRGDAEAYCRWLTGYYNSLKGRKYRKVIFRLPTQSEWYRAACGKLSRPLYPWGGPYLRNSKGAFLANFYPTPEYAVYQQKDSLKITAHDTGKTRRLDGAEFTCRVKSYFPNTVGYYNICGNAAELCSDSEGVTGGSWNSSAAYLYLSDKHYDRYPERLPVPSPMVGFRVFMQIIEK